MTPSVTISIEIELGWAAARSDTLSETPLSPGRSAETEYLGRLVALADDLEIPITFDVVGHLLHSSCSGDHSGPYTDDWFGVDPGTDAQSDPHFYAPELVDKIVTAETSHEMATHTYSHVHCERESKNALALELERARRRHREFGLSSPSSFVPPCHERVSYDVLRDSGIEVVRVPNPEYAVPEGGVGRFLWNLYGPHPVRPPSVAEGVVETYCTPHPSLTAGYLKNGTREPRSEYQYLPVGTRQHLHYRTLVRAAKSAIEAESELHLWTHLYNLANEEQWGPIESFLRRLATFRTEDDVRVRTMGEIARRHTTPRATQQNG